MFLNDPMMYGATFPYRDLPVQNFLPWQNIAAQNVLPWQNIPVQSFLPWQNVQRFIPPFYGFQTPHFNVLNPYLQTQVFPPIHQVPQINTPQFIPQMTWQRPLW